MILEFEIVDCSSYSSAYHPNNIKTCNHDGVVTDQSSRWSSNSNNQHQFMTLKLKQHAHLQSILFGKFHKVHVCNLKEFKVFISYNNRQYIEILHDGLKNDTEPESFDIRTTIKSTSNVFPVQYIKICPILAHGTNFNFSIWYLELNGEFINEKQVDGYIQHHTELCLKVMLKYLRQNNDFLPIYDQFKNHTNISLEHPYLQDLYNYITNGDFDQSYSHLDNCKVEWFDDFLSQTPYQSNWQQLSNVDLNGQEIPSRGGHQMVHTPHGIFLYGGWTGKQDLSDLWHYTTHWKAITSKGPTPRSCHKMIYNKCDNNLYIFGKYVDQEARTAIPLNADFWKFDLNTNEWECISANTVADGGPLLLFDHQMIVDEKRNIIYCFGGKQVLTTTETIYSGLFKYDCATSIWTKLNCSIKPRISHSMLYHPKRDCLFVFSGQINKDYASDMYKLDLNTLQVTEITNDYSKTGGPHSGYTQRATIDVLKEEIYVFSGLIRDKFSNQDTVRNAFWVYYIHSNHWRMVFQNELQLENEPVPRYAHQLAYDGESHYLFGGNPGNTGNSHDRLNDFWKLTLHRPQKQEILQKLRLLIKIQQYCVIYIDLRKLVL